MAILAKPDRKGNFSADQKQLILVAEQHPIYDGAISMIKAYREPTKLVSLYGNMKHENNRFNYCYSTMGTYTGRLSGKSSSFWIGTNPQNIPTSMRKMVVADPGKILIDIDYSQADLYHFAVAVGDKNMIANVFDDRDTHSVHVEMILKVAYDTVMAGKRNNDKFVTHPITGVRQIIKKVTHGGNYGMRKATAYLNAGRAALFSAARTLGHDPSTWDYDTFLDFTDVLIKPYFEAYPQQLEFRKEVIQRCVANKGLVTVAGGLTVYFHEWDRTREHDSLMRALLATYGQAGTAGMINRAMLELYYTPYKSSHSFLIHHDIDLLLQTHDSMTFQVPIERLVEENLLNEILLRMEISSKFNNMEYVVPCEASIGPRWGKDMIEVKNNANSLTTTMKMLQSYETEHLFDKDYENV
jgi:DNA polymerase I-like protein with 3'-5' exonuclease and polymerase domains